MHNKALDLVINNPPAQFFSSTAQEIVAIGIATFFILWGLSKIFRKNK